MLRACDPAAMSDIQDEALPLESSATVRGPARSLSSLRLGNAEQRRHIRAGAVGLVAVSVAGVVLVATVVRAQAASTSRHPSGSAIAANSLRCPAEMPGALPAYPARRSPPSRSPRRLWLFAATWVEVTSLDCPYLRAA
jgi:hypothetical protein